MSLEGSSNLSPPESGSPVPILPFSDYWENDDHVRANDKQRFILAACHGIIKDFSLQKEPYLSCKKAILPTRDNFRQEILRRDPTKKGLKN